MKKQILARLNWDQQNWLKLKQKLTCDKEQRLFKYKSGVN